MEEGERRAPEEGRKEAPGLAVESEPSEEAQQGRVAHPGPKWQEGSGNGLNTNNDTGKMSTINKQGESQGEGITEEGKMGKVRDLQK